MTRAAVWSWAFLVVASVATGLLIEDGSGLGVVGTVALILAIAVIKVRVIVLHYMELKHAPLAWRAAFELWPLLVAMLIFGIWYFTGVPEAACVAEPPAG